MRNRFVLFFWSFIAVVLLDRKPETLEEAVFEEKQDGDKWWVTEEKYGSPGENNLWRMSANLLMISVPHEYDVTQADAGGISAVTVRENLNDTDLLSFNIISSQSWDGPNKPQEEIVATELEDVTRRTGCEAELVDEVVMDCYQGMLDGKAITIYVGQLDDYRYVSIRRWYNEHEGLDLVLASTNWKPTKNETVGSIIIP